MTFVGACTGGGNGATATVTQNTLTLPGGAASGDWVYAITATNTNGAISSPGSWTIAAPITPQSTNVAGVIIKRQLNGTDISNGNVATAPWDVAGRVVSAGGVFRGLDATTQEETPAAATVTVGATNTAPTATTTKNGSDVFEAACTRKTTTYGDPTFPGTYTDDATAGTAFGSNANIGVGFAHLTTPGAAGAYGGGTVGSSPAAAQLITFAVALRLASKSGASTGAVTWVGSATGTHVSKGSATGSITWVGSTTGTRTPKGSASGAVSWVGSATGAMPVAVSQGSAAGAVSWVGTATGTHVSKGAASGAVAYVGSATGTRAPAAVAAGAITWAGTVNGQRASAGSATGAVGWIGSAVGVRPALPAQPTPPERVTNFTLPDRSSSWTLPDRTSSLTLPPRTTSMTLGA